jgi:processive 1,2-diacylglycerol beta-glucosyltransferase
MKILIIYASAGEGHKKIAQALYQEFKDFPQFSSEVQLIDILDYAPNFFKKGYPLVYQLLVKYVPFLWGFGFWLMNQKVFLFLLNPIRRFFNSIQIRRLTDHIDKENPDWIIHTHYLAPGALGSKRKRSSSAYQMMTVVTDFKVHGFWINPGQDLYVGMCETTRKELLRWGIPEERIALWGIPVHPKFRRHAGRSLLMSQMGLDPARKTILLTSGGFGLSPAEKILDQLELLKDKVQVLVVTGRNKKMYDRLKKKTFSFPVSILGFMNNMEELMEVSDVAVVKPGGSTACELLVKACPFFMLKPIPGQEEGNGEVLILEGISHFLEKPEDFLFRWKQLEEVEVATRLRAAMENFARPEAGLRIVEYVYAQHERIPRSPHPA